MTLMQHTLDFYSIHTKTVSDCAFNESLFFKCKQYGISEEEVDRAIEAMLHYKHNAATFDKHNRFCFTYKLGRLD